jgi:transcriptional regulator with XRE-family HTH domain
MEIQEIKKYMKDNRITYNDLADMTGLSISTLKKIFCGVSQYPRIDTMQAIERALGLEQEKTPSDELSEGEKQLIELIKQMTDEEATELSNYIDFIISKRKQG